MKDWEPEFLAMVEEEWATWRGKGDEYTIGRDRLFNFTSAAEKLGMTPAQIWAVYFWKHVCSVLSWAKTGDGGMEGIESRLLDIAVYAKLGRLIARMDKPSAPTPAAPALRLILSDRQPRPLWRPPTEEELRRFRAPVDLTPQIFYRDGNKETAGAEYVADAWNVPLTGVEG